MSINLGNEVILVLVCAVTAFAGVMMQAFGDWIKKKVMDRDLPTFVEMLIIATVACLMALPILLLGQLLNNYAALAYAIGWFIAFFIRAGR